jgi:hypothetical protein
LLKGSFSEEDAEDVVVEVLGCEKPFKTHITQRFDLICKLGVGISVDDRNLVSLSMPIQLIVRVIRRTSIP